MNPTRLKWKVGLFILLTLTLAGGLIIQFSKGGSFLTPTYTLLVKTRNVGGIKKGASALMAGVPVGHVERTDLSGDGREVIIRVRLPRDVVIHADARFVIEESGFLGDQYVSIMPTENAGLVLRDGAVVACEEPFNLQEAARSAAGFLQRVDQTVSKFNVVVDRLDRTLLSEATLSNLTLTLSTFQRVSERTLSTVDHLENLVQTNAPGIAIGVSNLVEFSAQLNQVADELQDTVTTNRGQFTAVLKNIDSATILVNDLLTDLQAGRGLAGGLLKDQQLHYQMSQTISNLSVLSSNLARFGLLHKPKAPKSSAPARSPLAPSKGF